jgi:excisionase family DNA binding protein
MASDWVTTTEAAELSGYHSDHVRYLIAEKKIKAQKWGRDWQVSRSDLLAYVSKMEKAGEKRGPKPKS